MPNHAILLSTLLSLAPVAGDDPVTDALPLRRITLYRSGVGYFEHAAEVKGDRLVQMRFDEDKINDILKSMTLLDLGGGTLGSVRYGSREPLSRRLTSFGVDLSESPSSWQLFQQLRGAGLALVRADGSEMEGTILGVERRKTAVPAALEAGVINQRHLNLLTDDGVRSIPLDDLLSWRLTDPSLASELGMALAALAEQRTERIKAVDLSFFGGEDLQRTVIVSYVHEMPVWKTSYRLVLPEDEDAQPKLQGWAIVENTTDEEWRTVQLSLASGRPSSFTMDLYEPIFTDRPDLPVPTEAGLVARNYESKRRKAEASNAGPSGGAPGPASPGRPTTGGFAGRKAGGGPSNGLELQEQGKSLGDWGLDAGDLGESQATGGLAGGQFLYTVNTPVTLARQRSAMLPILLADVTGRRVSIFNPADGSRHPLRGVEMTNDTRLHLMPGPIAVFDGGTFAGDAQIPHTARNQDRLLAYALDLDVSASTETEGTSTLVAIKIVDGLVEQRTKQVRRASYAFVNYDSEEARTLLVEHARTPGWERVEPAEEHERTEGLDRFELPLPAAGEASLTVVEERVLSQSYQLSQLDLDRLLEYRRNGKASQAVVEAVTRAAGLQSEANDFQRDLARLDQERKSISAEQARIRENLARIQQSSELSRRYVGKLGEQEDRLEEIQEQRAALEDARALKLRELQSFLRDLDVE